MSAECLAESVALEPLINNPINQSSAVHSSTHRQEGVRRSELLSVDIVPNSQYFVSRDSEDFHLEGSQYQADCASLVSVSGNPLKPTGKFTVQLIESTRLFRRMSDAPLPKLPSNKAEKARDYQASSQILLRPSSVPAVPVRAGENDRNFPKPRDPKCERPPDYLRPRSIQKKYSQSLLVSYLDSIESSQSGESNPPSLSTSPSAISENSLLYKQACSMKREKNVDQQFSGCSLSLAAQTAKNQLRDQAMAAFPNSDYHEPVDHFIDRDTENSTDVEINTTGAPSLSPVNWDLRGLQENKEKIIEGQQKNGQEQRSTDADSGTSQWRNPTAEIFPHKVTGALNENLENDKAIEKMRKRAKPPMLGDDLTFRRCKSPEGSKIDDIAQGIDSVEPTCQLTATKEGLWKNIRCAPYRGRRVCPTTDKTPSTETETGLWGGYCLSDTPSSIRPIGLLTPKSERENPLFTPQSTPVQGHQPVSSMPSFQVLASIDEKLRAEVRIEKEFSDRFITQVYNYLSLGFPAMAKKFDDELSRISMISIEELRQHDSLAEVKGYLRLGPDGNAKELGVTEENCIRWRALRIYIREWAKQHPDLNLNGSDAPGGFAVATRKGSWAF